MKPLFHDALAQHYHRPWLQELGDIFNELSTLISTVSWGQLKRKGN